MSYHSRLQLVTLAVIAVVAGLSGCSNGSKTDNTNPGIVTGDTQGQPDVDLRGQRDPDLFLPGDLGELKPLPDGSITPGDALDPCSEPPYSLGCPCEGNTDCEGGFCVEGPHGFVCTEECFEECPEGWHCKGISGFGSDLVFLCVPESKKLCYPCEQDSQCGGGICISIEGGGYCSYTCDNANPCPGTFSCTTVEKDDGTLDVCLPDSGSCECTAQTEGQMRPCTVENEFGACVGFETCDPSSGWVECTAATPAEEICDGKDNDCDGAFDEELPEAIECANEVEGVGACKGSAICLGPEGWVCTAPEPALETCDFKDNDCDGEVDEDFKLEGKYGTQNHCGTCNQDCTGAIEHATALCDAALSTPLCVVDECDDGYYPLNAYQCLAVGQTLCKPCVNDLQCEGGACISFSGGQFCTQSCTLEPCPEFFQCESLDGIPGKWCVPVSGTCDCSKENAGSTRPCSVENEMGTCFGTETCDPEIGWVNCTAGDATEEICDGIDNDCNGVPDDGLPGASPCELSEPGIGTCTGIETCLGTQGWVCSASKPEPELCDYKDNNCDGKVDEDFIINGKYGTLHHCGSCDKDCEGSLPNATAYCDNTLQDPKCKVETCSPGYFKLNEFQCILPPDVQCKECDTDADCYFDTCVPLDGGSYCLSPCEGGQCAETYHCEELDEFGEVCVPDTNSCECGENNAGAKRSCSSSNEFGICFGFETCDPEVGWTPCDALSPAPESCDGVDNDCNGLIDDGIPPSQPCDIENEWGSCSGVEVCMGNQGWVCQANEPGPEVCDYQDNNCDGQIDEDFKQGAKYYLDNHCGTCNNECADAIPNATGKCDDTYLVPKCVVEECAEGYFQVSPFQCVVPPDTTCQACESNDDCVGSLCVEIDGKQRCAKPCLGAQDCEGETTCAPYPGQGNLCLPLSGSCECNSFTAGSKRSCAVGNDIGTCYGFQTCDPEDGWSECDALEPGLESCNGIDDDCNGLIDDGLPQTQPCSSSNEWGECLGQAVCIGNAGWVCQAPSPAKEICDYIDNNCNGDVDEGFINDEGKYNQFNQCGSCTISCAGGFPHAVAKCDDTKETPQCVVESCEEGYFKLNEFQCIPNVASLCEPCSTDDNCILEGAKCIELADGSYCSKHCDNDGDCPDGYHCQPYEGDQQCFPITNSCTCDGSNPDLSKSCSSTWPPDPGPGEPFITCYGTQFCGAQGWSDCVLPEEACDGIDNDCNGVVDDDYLQAGKYYTDQHCGQCGNNCTFLQYPNASGVCNTDAPSPDCMMQCNNGYFDVNANPSDGCECGFLSATDLPDVDCPDPPICNPVAKDQNCDGVDGELNNAIFVAKNGSNNNPGTIDEPMLTIDAAIAQANSTGKRDVYVATGVYSGSFSLTKGIGVYGGYSSDFLQRNIVLYETVIMGSTYSISKPGAVNAISITGAAGSTVVDGFTVFGKNNNAAGGSSYAVYVKNSTNALRLSNNHVIGGNGGNGSSGDGGNDGGDGTNGNTGANAYYYNTWNCNGTKVKDGGNGGTQACNGQSVSGGDGGDSNCPHYNQAPGSNENGAKGSGTGGGNGGGAGWDGRFLYECGTCNVPTQNHAMEGADGSPGNNGNNGTAGAGCTQIAGQVSNGLWSPANGGTAGNGSNGAGGGGGGSGGGADVVYSWTGCNDHIGGTGGGGGSGACAGTAGTAGTGGGGSFGLFVVFDSQPASVPQITGNSIEGAVGGAGGFGGAGGTGGVGGAGGEGGNPGTGSAWCANGGGTGGDGGNGGHGGGGGGGCGGVSYCIFTYGQGNANISSYNAENECIVGSGGPGGGGGPSIGNSGNNGLSGSSGAANF